MIIVDNLFINRIAIVVTAVILDLIIGDPHFMWHPVRGMGNLISMTEKLLRKRFGLSDGRDEDKVKKQVAGLLLVMIVLTASIMLPLLIIFIAGMVNPWLKFGVECIMCYQLLAMKSLRVESMKVYMELKSGNLENARHAVSMIVGRDTDKLDEDGIIRATVETIAENTSDGVIAPLLYMLAFGTIGGFFYKAVNTMDSMIGYKNDKYIFFGRAAAKLDDIANYIPSRVSAIFMIAASAFLRLDYRNAWKIYKRDRNKHASPNSAQTEACCAGALSVMLAGNAFYFGKLYEKPVIGDPIRSIESEDIKRANKLMYATSFLVCGAGILVLAILGG